SRRLPGLPVGAERGPQGPGRRGRTGAAPRHDRSGRGDRRQPHRRRRAVDLLPRRLAGLDRHGPRGPRPPRVRGCRRLGLRRGRAMSATSATGPPAAELSAGAQARLRIRRGFSGPTSGMAAGLVQANLICVPADWAFDVLLFAQRNPKPCPVIDVVEPGQVESALAPGSDLRTDLPGYRIWQDGRLSDEVTDVTEVWDRHPDLVSFLIGCSFTFESGLSEAGLPIRHQEAGRNVPMYRTSTACAAAGRIGGAMVVSMRPRPATQAAEAVPHPHASPRPLRPGLQRSAGHRRRRHPRVLGLRSHPAGGHPGLCRAVRDHPLARPHVHHRRTGRHLSPMTASPLTFHTASRRHLLVECEDLTATMALHRSLEAAGLPGVVELVPAARTVLISFDPRRTGAEALEEAIRGLERTDSSTGEAREVTIDVRYDGEDLAEVAELLSVSPAEVIARHQAATWQVAFAGFAPGFGYL